MVRIGAQLLIAAWLLLAPAGALASELRVHFFDVGQGSAALIIAPSGKTVLIDAGPPEAAAALHARLSELLPGPIDLAILSHAHLDHFGGMAAALGVRGARLFMDSGFDHPSESYAALLRFIDGHQIRRVNASPGHSFDLGGGARLDVLAPAQPFLHGTRSDAGANSIVVKLVYGHRSVLFTGDALAETEAVLLANKADLRADVLVVAHHGAGGSSTTAFLDAVRPGVAIISSGPGNPIEAPSRAVIDRILGEHARVLRTDLDGEVGIVTDGESLHVELGDAPVAAVARVEKPPAERHPHAREHGHAKASTAAAVERSAAGVSLAGMHVLVPPKAEKAAPAHGGGSYVASKNSEVFHLADCSRAERIKPANRVTFRSRQAAVDSGRRPASCCNP